MHTGRGVKTEWYGPTHGTMYAVRYKYNLLVMKRNLGPTTRSTGETPATPQAVLDKYVGRDPLQRTPSPIAKTRDASSNQERSPRRTPPKLDLQTIKSGGMLPVSPPASPPFSPTDNNREVCTTAGCLYRLALFSFQPFLQYSPFLVKHHTRKARLHDASPQVTPCVLSLYRALACLHKQGIGGELKYPSGNWSFGGRAGPEMETDPEW